jgi:phenol 2-monooxygenase
METFNTGNGFTSGVGVEYPENILVEHNTGSSESAVSGDDYLSGILRPGRRLLNVRMKRFADGWQRDLHDGTYNSTNSFRLVLTVHRSQINRPLPYSMPYLNRSSGSREYLGEGPVVPCVNDAAVSTVTRGTNCCASASFKGI